MRAFKTFTAVAALAAGLALAASANAAIFVGVSTDGGATITQLGAGNIVPTGPNSVTFFGNFAGYQFNGTASEGAFPDLLLSNSLDTSVVSPAGQLDIFVTVNDLTHPTPLYRSNFTVNSEVNALPVTLSTFVSPVDAVPGLAPGESALAGPVTFPSTTLQVAPFINAGPASPLYSVTAEYHVMGGLTGQTANSSINISSAAPEPATWGLMIMGFGGLGALLRGRRKAALA